MEKQPENRSGVGTPPANLNLLGLYAKIGLLTAFIGLTLSVVGLWIDRSLNTWPFATIGIVSISAPLVVWLNTRIIRRTIDKHRKASIKDHQEDA